MDKFCGFMRQVSSIRDIPHILELGLHPWLRALPKSAATSKWVTLMSSTLYRCDDITQFQDFEDAAKQDAQLKRVREAEAKPFIEQTAQALSIQVILQKHATEHLHERLTENMVLSLPAAQVEDHIAMRQMESYLRESYTKPIPKGGADANALIPDVDLDGCGLGSWRSNQAADNDRMYFRIIKQKAGRQRVQARDAAAGKKLRNHHFIVAMLGRGENTINQSLGDLDSASLSVFTCFHAEPGWLRKNLCSHEVDMRLQYSSRLCPPQNNNEADSMHTCLDMMLMCGAFYGTRTCLPFDDSQEVLMHSKLCGQVGHKLWCWLLVAFFPACVCVCARVVGAMAMVEQGQSVVVFFSAGRWGSAG